MAQHDANEPQGGVKVLDRRKFNVDGTLREGADMAAPESETSILLVQPTEAPKPQAVDEPPAEEAESAEATPLLSLLVSLATSAQIALGDIEAPGGKGRYVELQEAQGYIDMLEDLRRKTQGHLTKAEDRFLRSVLYELQMRFVARQQEFLAPRR